VTRQLYSKFAASTRASGIFSPILLPILFVSQDVMYGCRESVPFAGQDFGLFNPPPHVDSLPIFFSSGTPGSSVWTVVGWGSQNVAFTKSGTGTTTAANDGTGISFYYDDKWSIGFKKYGDTLSRTSCDTDSTNPEYRLCWHTEQSLAGINTGYRCGASLGSTTHERAAWMKGPAITSNTGIIGKPKPNGGPGSAIVIGLLCAWNESI
jgi:hypothetical protein